MDAFIGFKASGETKRKVEDIASATNHSASWIARRIVEKQLENMDPTNREAARELVAAISV